MPLLEAFDAGAPVICSNTTSLPEVGGNAVLTCDPTDTHAISGLMNRIIADDELRERLVQNGKKRLSAYSWEKSAHNLLAACERVMNMRTHLTEQHINAQKTLPLVSIVTPSYNQCQFIEQTINSVLSQNYPNIEYIVIDGGSTDKTVEILRSYGNRIQWVSEPDQGQTHAINKGMARVSGKIRAYLNSDDVLLPNAVEQIVTYFQQNPDCDMVYGTADYIDKEDRVIGSYNTADFSFDRLLQDCMVCQPAAFWRQRIVEKIGPFDEKLNYAMDYDYWLRIAKSGGNICFMPQKLACSRLYNETKTLSARSKIYKEIFKICRKHAGYTHQNYYIGYWNYIINETDNVAGRILRIFPHLHVSLGWLHFSWAHRDRYSMRQIAEYLLRKVKHYIGSSRIVRRAVKILKKKLSTIGLIKEPNIPVIGFGSDNWLEPMVKVAPQKRVAGHMLHIAGIAPVDLVMTISAEKKEVLSTNFKAKQYKITTFPVDAVGNKQITIRFSGFIEDDDKRRLAFLLQDTNIFAESDI